MDYKAMSANSQPAAPVINTWLQGAVRDLKSVGIESAQLDAEIILAHTIKEGRTHLHAHGDEPLDERTEEIANARLALRMDHVPIAYIIGHKDFYGRRFKVTTATLIPRPESEVLIDVLKEVLPRNQLLFKDQRIRLVDVGTGSGILGITAKLEDPSIDVTLVDIDLPALKVAESNAALLGADVQTIKSDLLASYPFTPDVIIANLPYVDRSWERSLETDKEPQLALFAGDGGTSLIKKLIVQASSLLALKGIIILEADPTQHSDIVQFAESNHFKLLKQRGYCLAFVRS
jgi:release factor glutamine methyltransferase